MDKQSIQATPFQVPGSNMATSKFHVINRLVVIAGARLVSRMVGSLPSNTVENIRVSYEHVGESVAKHEVGHRLMRRFKGNHLNNEGLINCLRWNERDLDVDLGCLDLAKKASMGFVCILN